MFFCSQSNIFKIFAIADKNLATGHYKFDTSLYFFFYFPNALCYYCAIDVKYYLPILSAMSGRRCFDFIGPW